MEVFGRNNLTKILNLMKQRFAILRMVPIEWTGVVAFADMSNGSKLGYGYITLSKPIKSAHLSIYIQNSAKSLAGYTIEGNKIKLLDPDKVMNGTVFCRVYGMIEYQ